MADNELGAYLRSRREAVTPAEAGIPEGPRRRTPGLRRAELATLAGVSVEYLTRLEQGRDRRPSVEIISALADALNLSAESRVHLHRLTKVTTGGVCTGYRPPARTVRRTVRILLDRLEPTPALVVNSRGDLLAHTAGYARLAGPFGLLEAEEPNLAQFVFTDPRARAAFPDWDRVADDQAAGLRAAASLGDPHAGRLADELAITAGARFTSRFEGSTDLPGRTGAERWAHPVAGDLALAYEVLELPDTDDQRLIVYLPADEAASAALDRLTARTISRAGA